MKISFVLAGRELSGSEDAIALVRRCSSALALTGHGVVVITDAAQLRSAVRDEVEVKVVDDLRSSQTVQLLSRCDAAIAVGMSSVPIVVSATTATPFVLVGEDSGSPGGGQSQAEWQATLHHFRIPALVFCGHLLGSGPAPDGEFRVYHLGSVGEDPCVLGQRIGEIVGREVGLHRESLRPPQSLGLAMIVGDEEESLRRCLATVAPFVDEMVVVHTGERRSTAELASRMGALVVEHRWQGDFALARNAGLKRLNTDWVLVLDADEVIPDEAGEILRLVIRNPVADAFLVEIVNLIGAEYPEGAVVHSFVRLFRRLPGVCFEGSLHEQVSPSLLRAGARIVPLVGVRIVHYGYLGGIVQGFGKTGRNFSIARRQVLENPHDAFGHYNMGVEYLRQGDRRRAIKSFQRAYRLQCQSGCVQPYTAPMLRFLATALVEEGAYYEALAVLEDGERMFPDYVDLTLLRGLVLSRLGRYSEALTAFQHCLNHGDATATSMAQVGAGGFVARRAMASAYLALGRVTEAIEQYVSAREEAPQSLGRLVPRGPAELSAKASYYQRAVEQAIQQGAYSAAVEWFRQLLSEGVRCSFTPVQLCSLWQRKLVLELIAGDPAAAHQDLEALWGVNPRAALGCHIALGPWLDRQRETSSPLAARAGPASEFSWEDVSACLNTLLDVHKEDWFADACARLAEVLPEKDWNLGLGKLLFRRGLVEAAVPYLMRALELGAQDAEACWELGEVSRRRGLSREARCFFRQAIRFDRKALQYWISLAASYQAAGKDRAAVKVLKLGSRFTDGELLHAARMAIELSMNLSREAGSAASTMEGGLQDELGTSVECVRVGERS